jgi:hypothetical protein
MAFWPPDALCPPDDAPSASLGELTPCMVVIHPGIDLRFVMRVEEH